ncbi:DNA polymerase exonuclease subunit [Clavibacter phage CN1A]|uniref:DNA polymerase III epsilon subunit n=1 Tax=Clavibacter phage CN1A TaxID=1406793 RepID=U5PTC5_9CAUD|nr:DNA polymerase exonuclease subunit [Clavibacter phage CN1A]AGY47129.1 DNA polymerase III epsilon subunit [Clavibacter phage CN1A]
MKLKDIQKVAVFDLETTGVDVKTDRIVTAFVGVYTRDGDLVRAQRYLINPGGPIPESATAVHGITNEMVESAPDSVEGVKQIADDLQALIDQGLPLVVMNAAFDLSLLNAELERYELQPMRWGVHIIDPMIIDRAVAKFRKGKRKLVNLAEVYGVPVREDAHDAEADCVMAGGVAFKVLEKFASQFPKNGDMDTAAFYKRQQFWAADQAKSFQAWLRKKDPTAEVAGGWPVR